MPHGSSPAVTATWTDGGATVTVHGDLSHLTCAQIRERIAGVVENSPSWMVLNLTAVSEHFEAESLALIAVTRYLLPPGCVLGIRSASPAVRWIVAVADWGVS